MSAAVATRMRAVTFLGALALAVTSSSSCEEEPDSTQGAPEAAWSDVQEAACVGGESAMDHAQAVREQLSAEELEIFDEAESSGGQPSGAIDYLSCGGDAPFLRSFDTQTATQIWIKDELIPSGCPGSAVTGDVWVVYNIQDTAIASALVDLDGQLLDC